MIAHIRNRPLVSCKLLPHFIHLRTLTVAWSKMCMSSLGGHAAVDARGGLCPSARAAAGPGHLKARQENLLLCVHGTMERSSAGPRCSFPVQNCAEAMMYMNGLHASTTRHHGSQNKGVCARALDVFLKDVLYTKMHLIQPCMHVLTNHI
jgi:hypothetical protein